MTRSMAKSKQADVPSIYPLKGENKKPEHVKQPEPIPEKDVLLLNYLNYLLYLMNYQNN